MAGASAASPTVTDFQGTAGQNIDNSGAQALHDISQNGQLGQAAIAQAAQAAQAAKQAALTNAMAYSVLRGAPAGNVAANQATIAQPFDQRASVLGLMGQNYKDNSDAMTQANQNFTAGAKAGLPIAQTALDRTISNNQSANAAKRDTQNFELSMKQAEAQSSIDAHNAARDAANARLNAANKPLTIGQIIAGLGGQDLAGDALSGVASGNLGTEQSQAQANANNGGGTGPSGTGLGIYDQLADTPGAVGSQIGLPTSISNSLVANSGTKDGTQLSSADKSAQQQSQIMGSAMSDWIKGIQAIQAGGAGAPADLQAVIDGLSAKYGPTIATQIAQSQGVNYLRPSGF